GWGNERPGDKPLSLDLILFRTVQHVRPPAVAVDMQKTDAEKLRRTRRANRSKPRKTAHLRPYFSPGAERCPPLLSRPIEPPYSAAEGCAARLLRVSARFLRPWMLAHHSTPATRQTQATHSSGVGQRPSHRKPYSRANRVSKIIICPIMVSGSWRLARFHKPLPMTDAPSATARLMPQKRTQSAVPWSPSLTIRAATVSTSASAPVTTPVSNDHSCEEMCDRRTSQRLLPTT